jgi:cob(I)alamin adenosyltransferase
MKIYTKTGDGGQTGLANGARVAKDDLRVAAYGDVDELNSVLGLLRVWHAGGTSDGAPLDPALLELLDQIQRDLFALGAQLADPAAGARSRQAKAVLTETHVERLEAAIDAREDELPPLRAFILPGGAPVGAWLHLARAVCRRAERALVSLGRRESLDPLLLIYLNRLSDLLFVLARHANHRAGRPEPAW